MRMPFTKMQGLGNDFMVIDGVTQDIEFNAEQVRQWSDRHLGVGFDQLLLVEPPNHPEVDFNYRIFNADGTEVAQCGNGARCVAAFVQREKLIIQKDIRVATQAGRLVLSLLDHAMVRVDMGVPETAPERVPFTGVGQCPHQQVTLLDGRVIALTAIAVGNPHAVLLLDEPPTDALVAELGPLLEGHVNFPQRTNVGFLYIEQPDQAQLRVYERGVGETLACGSGACAAVVAGRLHEQLAESVTLQLRGGPINIMWSGVGHSVFMTGPAAFVYDGFIELERT